MSDSLDVEVMVIGPDGELQPLGSGGLSGLLDVLSGVPEQKTFGEVAEEVVAAVNADPKRKEEIANAAKELKAVFPELNADQVSYAAAAVAKWVMENLSPTDELISMLYRLHDVSAVLWDEHRQATKVSLAE